MRLPAALPRRREERAEAVRFIDPLARLKGIVLCRSQIDEGIDQALHKHLSVSFTIPLYRTLPGSCP